MDSCKVIAEVPFKQFCGDLAKRLKVDEGKLSLEANWVKDVGVSSVDMIKILMFVKQKYGISVPASRAGKIITVNDAYRLLEKGFADA